MDKSRFNRSDDDTDPPFFSRELFPEYGFSHGTALYLED
jgi:hypothetical protein